MSLECSECERDLRGGHASDCSRNPNNLRKTVDANKEINELKAHVERLRVSAVEILNLLAEHLDGNYNFDSFSGQPLALAVVETPAQSLNHIKAQVEEETITRCVTLIEGSIQSIAGAIKDVKEAPRKYK